MIAEKSLRQRYEQLLMNMRSVGMARSNEKYVIVDNALLVPDHRPMQGLLRWISGDNRQVVVRFLQATVDEMTLLLQDPPLEGMTEEARYRLTQHLAGFAAGLGRIRMTYRDDAVVQLRLENLVDQVETFCRRTRRATKTSGV